MIRADLPIAAPERADALDPEHVRFDPLNPRAERAEEAAQVLDVRFAGRVSDHGHPGREGGDHDRVLGRHHARLVEEDVFAVQSTAAHLVTPADLDLGSQLGEGVNVRIEPPSSDHVSARRRSADGAEAREQRPREQERGADAPAEALVGAPPRDVGGMDVHLVRTGPVRLGSDVVEQLDHRLDVRDSRHVAERDRLGRQQTPGQNRQRAVLVARRLDPAVERSSALDHERLGGVSDDGCLGHRGSLPTSWKSLASAPGRR